MAQRGGFCYTGKCHLSELHRARCTLPYCHRDSCCRASPLAETPTPRPLGRLVSPAHSLAAGSTPLADGHCRLVVVLPLDRVCHRLGLAARTAPLGNGLGLACSSQPDAPAKLAGFTQESAVRVRLVPRALELRGAGGNTSATAGLARVGGNGTTLAACFGLVLEAHQAGGQR